MSLIDLSQSIVQNIIDLNPGLTKMKIDELNLTGVRNMGDIFISWDDNRVLDLIECQTNTNFHEKAEQFRLLKKNLGTQEGILMKIKHMYILNDMS